MLDLEYKYYQEHKKELEEKYLNKFVVIIGNEIKGIFDTKEDALKETIKTHKLGTFLIHHISNKIPDQIQRFTSRVFV